MFGICSNNLFGSERLAVLVCATLDTTLPLLVFAVFIGCVVALLAAVFRYAVRRGNQSLQIGALCGVAGFVAVLAGYTAGNARESVVGDIVPVLLGGVGALFGLAVTQKSVDRLLAGALAVCFSGAFIVGLDAGAANREGYRATAWTQTDTPLVATINAPGLEAALSGLERTLANDFDNVGSQADTTFGFPIRIVPPECPQGETQIAGRCVDLDAISGRGPVDNLFGPDYDMLLWQRILEQNIAR